MQKDTYKLIIGPQADKFLKKIAKKNKKDFYKIVKAIETIPKNPHHSVILKNTDNREKRIRKGNYRIMFIVNNNKIEITRIGKRSNIYDKLLISNRGYWQD